MARKPKVQPTNIIPFDRRTETDLARVEAEIIKIAANVNKHKADRAAASAEVGAARAQAPKIGIPKKALDRAMEYMGWDEDMRRGYDYAYQIARKALGAPVDLFSYADEQEMKASTEKPTKSPRKPIKTSTGESLRTSSDDESEQAEGGEFLGNRFN